MSKRNRSENITDEHIEIIVNLLNGWIGKLTWAMLVDAIDFKTNQHYTRQALANHTKIKQAYDETKKNLSSLEKKNDSIKEDSNEILKQKIKYLESENNRLKNENALLLAKFARWSYNAYIKGLSIDELDKNLPN